MASSKVQNPGSSPPLPPPPPFKCTTVIATTAPATAHVAVAPITNGPPRTAQPACNVAYHDSGETPTPWAMAMLLAHPSRCEGASSRPDCGEADCVQRHTFGSGHSSRLVLRRRHPLHLPSAQPVRSLPQHRKLSWLRFPFDRQTFDRSHRILPRTCHGSLMHRNCNTTPEF